MTTYYCDHGYTGYPTIFMSVPASAASLPQEGDGLASGTGATPAAASANMDFSAATAAAGATFAVHGATLTCVASGAGTTQFNAGSGSTLAANLATAINAATSVPTTTSGGISPYLKALVWATSSGSVLTVYTRIASAALNQSANASATLVCGTLGNWTSAPSTANFTGGVSGPWSMFWNANSLTAAISGTILNPGTYGAWAATIMGAPVGDDIINIRTGRANADIVLTTSTTAATTTTSRNVGSPTAYIRYLFDNGTVWNDGQSNGVFNIQKGLGSVNVAIQTQGYTHINGQMKTGSNVQAGGTANLKIWYGVPDASGFTLTMNFQSTHGVRHTIVEGLETLDSGLGAYNNLLLYLATTPNTANGAQPTLIRNSKLGHMVRSLSSLCLGSSSAGLMMDFVDCLFAFGNAATYTRALVECSNAGSHIGLRLIRPKFTGGGGGHHTLMKLASSGQYLSATLYIEDPVDLGQFIPSDSAASVCGSWSGASSIVLSSLESAITQTVVNGGGKREFLVDNGRYLYEWRNAGFPTTGLSTLKDGTPFSLRFNVASTAVGTGLVTPMCPQRGPRQAVTNTLGAGTRTLTARFLIDATYGGSAYTANDREWWLEGVYVSSVDGSAIRFSTQGTGTALAADSQAWTSLTYTPFAGASRNYTRHKIQVSLPNMAAGCDVAVRLMCGKQPLAMNEWVLIDPAVLLEV